MWNRKLCVMVNGNFNVSFGELLSMYKIAGFDGFFMDWKNGIDLKECKKEADKVGLIFQSVHAPFGKSDDMWCDDEKLGRIAVDELKECINQCAAAKVDLMICHAFIGFDDHTPTEIGLKRFGEVIDYAEKNNVTVAFENTEGEEYLIALLKEFGNMKNVGFCWDSGHEMCYNRSRDLLADYGSRLICTHINDNLGISDFNGEITWHDDLHLLPFDGIADWDYNANRLVKCGFEGPLTFELNTDSKPERHDNDKYADMPLEQYMAEAYARACRFAAKIAKIQKDINNASES